ncbi:MAG: response regulator [Thermoguttaceae bacterium]
MITDDPEFQAALQDGAKRSQLDMRFTGSAYECSTLVATFSPDCVLLDGSMPQGKREQLRTNLARDPRVSSTKIILAAFKPRPARLAEASGELEIVKPFSAAELRSCIENPGTATAST